MAFFVESTASLYSVMILQSGMTISISVLEALLEHQNLSVDKRIFDKDMHLRPSLPRSFLLLVLIPHLQVRSFFRVAGGTKSCAWHFMQQLQARRTALATRRDCLNWPVHCTPC